MLIANQRVTLNRQPDPAQLPVRSQRALTDFTIRVHVCGAILHENIWIPECNATC